MKWKRAEKITFLAKKMQNTEIERKRKTEGMENKENYVW
jgi:hypothetical protein